MRQDRLRPNRFLTNCVALTARLPPEDNGWFVGFAPRSAPEIAVFCVREAANMEDTLGPIARDVMKSTSDKSAP
jgi:cell division protein FtsI/penicillin-binding protein 2